MKYAVVFSLLSAMLTSHAIYQGGVAWMLLWPAVSFLIVAIAYGGAGVHWLGKKPDGHIACWALMLHLPFFLLTWSAWHVVRWLSREAAMNEVVPGFWIGRRPLPREVPEGVTLVVDLTAEFPERAGVRAGRTYVNVPCLDAMTPDEEEMRTAVALAAGWPEGVLIHCASGHGRTGLFAAAVLLARGVATDLPTALRLLQTCRLGVRLNRRQRQSVERLICTA